MLLRVSRSLAVTGASILIATAMIVAISLAGRSPSAKDRLPTEAEVLATASLPVVQGAMTQGDVELLPVDVPGAAGATVAAPSGPPLPQGFLVGASRVNLYPTPGSFGGTEWQTEGCNEIDDPRVDDDHALPPTVPGWVISTPNCIYLGGFGIGPERPANAVGQGGIWVRSIAISNGEDTFIYQIADTVGWFARYRSDLCTDCGILDVRTRVANEVGIDLGDVVTASTHTHSGADTYGGWGGIPGWYRKQIADSAVAGAKQAIANLRPAAIRYGELHLRNRNNERRDTYYSTADTAGAYLQALTLPGPSGVGGGYPFATLGVYAGHPTIVNELVLHADWPGAAARRFEARTNRSSLPAVGVMFEGALGNVSISGVGGATKQEEAENTGAAIADQLLADAQSRGQLLTSNALVEASSTLVHPVTTNPGLVTLNNVGLFDRETAPPSPGAGLPCSYYWSKQGETSDCAGEDPDDAPDDTQFLRGCSSTGPSVITAAGAHRIGEIVIAFGPGEIFSTLGEVIRERADQTGMTTVLGQTNDALGYIVQSFEYDMQGNVVTEYGTMTGEYEEVFAVDRCLGDHVLETILESTAALGAGG